MEVARRKEGAVGMAQEFSGSNPIVDNRMLHFLSFICHRGGELKKRQFGLFTNLKGCYIVAKEKKFGFLFTLSIPQICCSTTNWDFARLRMQGIWPKVVPNVKQWSCGMCQRCFNWVISDCVTVRKHKSLLNQPVHKTDRDGVNLEKLNPPKPRQ